MSLMTAGGARSTGAVAIATQAKAATGRLLGVTIIPSAAVTPTVTVYDNASASSGTELYQFTIQSNVGVSHWFGPEGIDASLGIRIDSTSFATLKVICHFT